MVHFYPLFIPFICFIRFSYGQFEGPPDFTRAYDGTIDLSPYPQGTFTFTANDDEFIMLYNISISFENGECIDPVVTFEFEPIDNNGVQSESLYIFYDTFNNESQIARCNFDTESVCDTFAFCTEFEPPSGAYEELIFFVATGYDIDNNCGSGTSDDPRRSIQGRFTVSCQPDIDSLCPIQTTMYAQEEEEEKDDDNDDDEEGEGSSSESSDDDAIQEFGHRLTERHDLENESKHNNEAKNKLVSFKLDDHIISNNLLIMFVVVGLCVCCIAQCGYIYVLKKKLASLVSFPVDL